MCGKYIGGIPHEYMEGYHEYIGGCSVHWGDIMIHVGGCHHLEAPKLAAPLQPILWTEDN